MSSVTKIVAGLGMIIPGFVLHTFKNKDEKQNTTGEAALETAKVWAVIGSASIVIGITTFGFAHLFQGVYELSPKICWRE